MPTRSNTARGDFKRKIINPTASENEADFKAHLATLTVEELESGAERLISYLKALPEYGTDPQLRQMVADTEKALLAMSEEEAHRVSQDLLKQVREQRARQEFWDTYCKSREEFINAVLRQDEHFDQMLTLAREQAQSERDYGIYQPEAWVRLTSLGLL